MHAERDFAVGFFDNPSTEDAITALAEATSITLFLGAGASADQGLPSWASLVRKLLAERLSSATQLQGENKRLADLVLASNPQVSAASIVDELFLQSLDGKKPSSDARRLRNEAIRAELYGANPEEWVASAPSTMQAVLELACILKIAGKDVHIASTNYDIVGEWVKDNSPAVKRYLQVWNYNLVFVDEVDQLDGVDPKSDIPFVYLHGRIGVDGEASERIVFSEADYADWMVDGRGFSSYFIDRVASSALLLVGTSMRDYNISNILRRHGSNTLRVALLPIQGEVADNLDVPHVDWPILANFAVKRGDHLRVRILRPDFFGQVTQFLLELGYRVASRGVGYTPYTRRIRLWATSWNKASYNVSSKRQRAQKLLRELAVQLVHEHDQVEHAKVEVWVRANPDRRLMERWCSSSASWPIDTDGVWPLQISIDYTSTHPSVLCFASRGEVHGFLPLQSPIRWTHFLALPIILDGDRRYSTLPVGAIVAFLSSPTHAVYPQSVPRGPSTVDNSRYIPSILSNLPEVQRRMIEVGTQTVMPRAVVAGSPR